MRILVMIAVAVFGILPSANAHQATSTYIANEAVLITNDDKKVLFDPFFHQSFGIYQLVPEDIKQAIFDAIPPYDDITAIVISHAHGDHFAADDVLRYLQNYPNTQFIAPQQAILELSKLDGATSIEEQVHGIELSFNQAPKTLDVAGLTLEAVRIPHAGWPGRADVENLVFRVTLNHSDSPVTIMHMGDADPDYEHYSPFKVHWQKRSTDTVFPPYWFYLSAEGNYILDDMLNIKQSVGIHVPIEVPVRLKKSGKTYFSKPGETHNISQTSEPQ